METTIKKAEKEGKKRVREMLRAKRLNHYETNADFNLTKKCNCLKPLEVRAVKVVGYRGEEKAEAIIGVCAFCGTDSYKHMFKQLNK